MNAINEDDHRFGLSAAKKYGKLYVECNLPMHNKRFILDGTEYMFSLREDIYEIRKLSGTFNANVIFSLKLKDNHPPFDNLDFENYIK